MSDFINTNYKFIEPEVGASEDSWGNKLNDNWGKLDALLNGDSYTDLNSNIVQEIQPNLTVGAWEIDGTAVTATAAEINYVDGVTSNVQTQLDAKADAADAALTGTTTAETVEISTAATVDDNTVAVLGLAQDFAAAQRTAAETITLNSNQTADLSLSNVFVVDVNGSYTLSASNIASGGCYTFIIKNTGAYDIDFSDSFYFSGGDPVITSGAGKRDLVSCVSDGTSLYCSINYDLTSA